MNENEEKQLVALKEEMDEVGEKYMDKGKKSVYILLRQKQKSERRTQQETIQTEHKKPMFGKFGILWGLLPFVIIALIVWIIMSINWKDYKSDCVIGRDSPDCLEGEGVGHPLWQR